MALVQRCCKTALEKLTSGWVSEGVITEQSCGIVVRAAQIRFSQITLQAGGALSVYTQVTRRFAPLACTRYAFSHAYCGLPPG